MDRRTVLHGAGFAVALFVASGCGGGGGDSCTDECEVLDDTRCYGSVIEACTEAEDGCMYWTAQTHCEDTMQFCDDSGEAPACVYECTDECTTEDETQCRGSVIETCTAGSDGCLDWAPGTDCDDTGQFCEDSMCVDECMDECLPAASTQCDGTVIEACTEGSDGCLDWVAGTDCNDTDEMCGITGGAAACYTDCTDECDTEGATQCDTDMVQYCVAESDGCSYWEDVYDCTTTGYYCDDASGDAYCIRPCVDECDTDGAQQCSDMEVIQTCTLNTWDGCNYLVDGTDCTGTGEVCDVDSGVASCVPPTYVLLMGDDVTSTGWDEYRNALTAAGVRFDERDLDTGSFPTLLELADYEVLIWFDESTMVPGDTQCQIVVDWLATGGKNFFASSIDFLWDLENGTDGLGEHNLYLMFETEYVGSSAGYGVATLDGVTADPITDPFSTTGMTLLAGSDSSGDYASTTLGASVKAGIYGTGGTGSGYVGFTYYDGSTYKIAWLGLNFHNGLTDTTQKNTLMDNIMTWFGY